MLALALAAGLSTSCIEPLQLGEFGNFRYLGVVTGRLPNPLPLPVTPPYADRDGNVYVALEKPDEYIAFVGMVHGGWKQTCKMSDILGDSLIMHGWVGHTDDTAWFWSTETLVSVTGSTGACGAVLQKDPRNGTTLHYQAVLPWVKETPARATVVALVKSDADAVPFQVLIDLTNEVFLTAHPFEPSDAVDVTVLGVGADRETTNGYLVVKFRQGDQTHLQGRVIDSNGETLSSVELDGGADLGANGIVGFLHSTPDGLVAGLDNQARVVTFDGSKGGFRPVSAMTPVGVHVWNNKLYVVGTAAEGPVIAEIDAAGNVGAPVVWEASVKAAAALKGPIVVENDRAVPRRRETWQDPIVSAIGPYPFVTAHSLTRYFGDSTGWLIAGPSYDTGGDRKYQVAFGAVGISYP